MGDIKIEGGSIPIDKTGESTLRGDKTRGTDATLRLDGEEDTLYEDGLELEDDSGPLTGKDGKDDSQRP